MFIMCMKRWAEKNCPYCIIRGVTRVIGPIACFTQRLGCGVGGISKSRVATSVVSLRFDWSIPASADFEKVYRSLHSERTALCVLLFAPVLRFCDSGFERGIGN